MKGVESLPSQLRMICSLCPLGSTLIRWRLECEYVVAFDVVIVLPAPFVQFCERNVSVSKARTQRQLHDAPSARTT
jgi:hypothetical protein